jgi:hypothetical protein
MTGMSLPIPPGNRNRDGGARALVATIHAADGVRLAVSTDSRAVLIHRLAEYVRARADDVLWPEEAGHLHALLADGDLTGAVECYFWHVGGRWDSEWLVTSLSSGP